MGPLGGQGTVGVAGDAKFANADFFRGVVCPWVEALVRGLAGGGGVLEKGEMLIAFITVRPVEQWLV